jgi:biopolymer transport protein TolR
MGAPLEPGGALANRRARRRSRLPMSEINVAPLVGVMLALLIIFMVTAPLLTVGVGTSLPDVTVSATETETDQGPLSITVDAGGKIFLQDSEIGSDDLVPKLTAIREAFGANQVRVRADKATSYGDLADVLVRLKEAGFSVTLVTDRAP